MSYNYFRRVLAILLWGVLFLFISEIVWASGFHEVLTDDMEGVSLHWRITQVLPDDAEAADSLAALMLSLCEGRGDSLEGLALFDLGEAAYYSGDYHTAGDYYSKSLVIFDSLKNYARQISLYNDLGLAYYLSDRYTQALDAFIKSAQIIKEHGDDSELIRCLHNIALVHQVSGNLESARTFFESSLSLCRQKDEVGEEGPICNDFAAFLVERKNFDRSIMLYQRALEIFVDAGQDKEENIVLFNLGCLYNKQGNYEKAESYFLRSQVYFETIDDQESLMSVYSELGDLYFRNGEAVLSVPYFRRVEKMSQTLGGTFLRHKNLYSLYKVLKAAGRYPEALETLETYHQLKDSLEAQRPSADGNLGGVALEKELVDRELKLFRAGVRERSLIVLAVGLFVLLLMALGFIYFRYQQLKRVREKNVLKHRILRMQMNPHFIFNALTFLQGYILDDKKDDAADYLGDVTILIRRTLESTFSECISLEEEVSFLKSYFKVQCRRFEDKISYNVVTMIDGPESELLVPPMLAQPFVENAFEHALLHQQKNPSLEVSIRQMKGELEVTIEDNGVGIKSGLPSKGIKNYRPRAVGIVKERLALLHQMHKGGRADLEMIDLSSVGRQGTRVRFWLPIIYCKTTSNSESE